MSRDDAVLAGTRAIFRSITGTDGPDGSELDEAMWSDAQHFAELTLDVAEKDGHIHWARVDATAYPEPIGAKVSHPQPGT